jgi:hypothetical protein
MLEYIYNIIYSIILILKMAAGSFRTSVNIIVADVMFPLLICCSQYEIRCSGLAGGLLGLLPSQKLIITNFSAREEEGAQK